MQAASNEIVYLTSNATLVTNTRIVVKNTTYVMSNVTSTRIKKIDPDPSIPYLMIGAGLVAVMSAAAILISNGPYQYAIIAIFGGVATILTGEVFRRNLSPLFTLLITTSGGESQLMHSYDKHDVQVIADAITAAVVARG